MKKSGKKRPVVFRCDTALIKKLDKQAKDMGVSRTFMLERIIEFAIDFDEKVSQSGLFDPFAEMMEEVMKKFTKQYSPGAFPTAGKKK